MKKALGFCALLISSLAFSQTQSLLPDATMKAIIDEASGASAKRTLQAITTFNRIRGSREYHAAAEIILARAKAAGLADAHIEKFPADGKTFYGTLKARQAWDVDSADLWEVEPVRPLKPGVPTPIVFETRPVQRICSYEEMPVCLAEDSESADVTAELIDVGSGTHEKDYAGKDVTGKIVLISAQGSAAQGLAVDKHGAVGMVSYAMNQPQGWSGDDDSLVRWGHLDSYSPTKTFAFQISLRQARDFERRLARGERIWLHARVKAGRHNEFYEIVTGTLPGSSELLKNQEIVFSCHLDHQMPGANDNASGCATILEVARALHQLIVEGKIPPLKRTLRFVWPPEIEGAMIYLTSHPELVPRMKAAIHMDMVGGDQAKTKAIFHVTRTPDSIPSFVNDVAEEFGEYVRDMSDQFAATGAPQYAVYSAEGKKDALHFEVSEFTSGSDHEIYDEGSFRIPSIYLNDWPDRYIHTNKDSVDKIDPSKLKRAAIIGAASGYFLANLDSSNSTLITSEIMAHAKQRMALSHNRFGEQAGMAARLNLGSSMTEMDDFILHLVRRERANLISLRSFIGDDAVARLDLTGFTEDMMDWAGVDKNEIDEFLKMLDAPRAHDDVPIRIGPKGPMSVFEYNYLVDHFGAENTAQLSLFSKLGGLSDPTAAIRRASAGDYAYEILNLVDGKRTVQAIRDSVSAEFGPIPREWVMEYLQALQEIKVIEWKK